MPPLDPYQKRLLVFLGVASFFEGYDFIALGQILPNLRADLGFSEAVGGQIVGAISLGKEYAVAELAWTDAQVGLSVAVATISRLPWSSRSEPSWTGSDAVGARSSLP